MWSLVVIKGRQELHGSVLRKDREGEESNKRSQFSFCVFIPGWRLLAFLPFVESSGDFYHCFSFWFFSLNFFFFFGICCKFHICLICKALNVTHKYFSFLSFICHIWLKKKIKFVIFFLPSQSYFSRKEI